MWCTSHPVVEKVKLKHARDVYYFIDCVSSIVKLRVDLFSL